MTQHKFLTFNGFKIFTRLDLPAERARKMPAIIFLHGAKSNLNSFKYLSDNLNKQFICLSFDHLGCGKSGGKFTEFSLCDRLQQAIFIYDYLNSHKEVDGNKIVVFGSSMAGHVSCRLTNFRAVHSLVLRAPACYQKKFEKKKMSPDPGWLSWDKERRWWPAYPSYALEALGKFGGNLLIIKSEQDEIIPEELITLFYETVEASKFKKIVTLKNAPHRISNKPYLQQQLFAELIKFFQHASADAKFV